MAAYGVENRSLHDGLDAESAGRGPGWRKELYAAQEAELEAARGMYDNAGQVGTLAGTQLRSQQLPGVLAAAQAGGLEGNAGVASAGQVGYGAGLEGVRMAQGDRLAAAEGVMGAAAQRATYEQALMQALIQRRAAAHAAIDQRRRSQLDEEAYAAELRGQVGGSLASAAASGAVTATGWGGQY